MMVLPQKLKYVYIIVNIFVNTQSILKILVSNYNVFNGLYFCKNITTMFRSWMSMKVISYTTALLEDVMLSL